MMWFVIGSALGFFFGYVVGNTMEIRKQTREIIRETDELRRKRQENEAMWAKSGITFPDR